MLADLGLCAVAAMKGPLKAAGDTLCPEGWSAVYVVESGVLALC